MKMMKMKLKENNTMGRRAGGRGAAMVFDTTLCERVEEMKKRLGFYPTLREIRLSFNPPYSFQHVHARLQALIADGRLSADATAVYKVRPRKEKKENEKSVRKTGKASVKENAKTGGEAENKAK